MCPIWEQAQVNRRRPVAFGDYILTFLSQQLRLPDETGKFPPSKGKHSPTGDDLYPRLTAPTQINGATIGRVPV